MSSTFIRCPAILSGTSSLPEVGKNAAVYFDPNDAEEFTKTIEQVIYNDSFRQLLIEKGKDRLKAFTWEKTALKTKKLYDEVV